MSPWAPHPPPTIRVDGSALLRPWQPVDAVPLFEVVEGSREQIAQWLAWAEDYDREQAELFIDRALRGYDRGESLDLALEVAGAIAGGCGLVAVNADHREVEIGYWLSVPYTGRGLMTRTVAALTDYLFDTMGVHRVVIAALGGNRPSRAIPERLGFRAEGVFTASRWHRGRWHDLAMYAVLEDEWRVRRPSLDAGKPPR